MGRASRAAGAPPPSPAPFTGVPFPRRSPPASPSPSTAQSRRRRAPSARSPLTHPPQSSLVPEPVDLGQVLGAQFRIAHAEALPRSQAQHPDLAVVQVPVDIQGGLTGLLQRVD